MTEHHAERAFATCGACRMRWPSWDAFINDPRIELLGLQAVLSVPDANLLVFEHGCGSSVSILTRRLLHLLPGPDGPLPPSLRGTEHCPGHCLSLADLEACDRPCSNARDRDLIKLAQQAQRNRASAK
jgi:hypothetical protein